MTLAAEHPTIEEIMVTVCTVPTDQPESDGTLSWDSTTIVIVEARSGSVTGIGYTYGPAAVAPLIEGTLADEVLGRPALGVPAAWLAMRTAARNLGTQGPAAMAISAVDIALWDLAAHLLDLPLSTLLGRFRARVPVYGSGGFCSYDDQRLRDQLGGWVAQGIGRVKMKVGRDPDRDRERLRAARDAIGAHTDLFVDANGAFGRDDALAWAEVYARDFGVSYFEEPVSSDDLQGLSLLRDRAPAGLAIAAGEYGWDLPYFRAMIPNVGIQQADVTRCGGVTGLLQVGALCQAFQVPFSAHCAPAISAHVCTAIEPLLHLEYFHDHVRIESLLFEGALTPDGGFLEPDLRRAGLGLRMRPDAIAAYAESAGITSAP